MVVGAGAGLSTAAGLTYDGERFRRHFADFAAAYGFTDMYRAGFGPFASLAEKWAYWSRHIMINRYDLPDLPVMADLRAVVAGREHVVVTTNVDHLFWHSGFDPERIFATQGDYGRWQCSVPCHQATYDNEATVRAMVARQRDRRVPADLLPWCPRCGAPMENHLRVDDTFVQDEEWHAMAGRYAAFLDEHAGQRIVFLELGVGANTPGIIKYPFWRLTHAEPLATYACLNLEVAVPVEIADRSIAVAGDIGASLRRLRARLEASGG